MLVVLLASSLAAVSLAPTPATRAAAVVVKQAYSAEEQRQVTLPLSSDVSERLTRLLRLDQAGRKTMKEVQLKLNTLPAKQRQVAHDLVWAEINAHDLQDQKALKSMIPAEGWFTKSRYKKDATLAAFMIVQHAVNDPELMRSTLGKMEGFLPLGEVDGGQYALLYDRVSLEFDHKPQRYGSQAWCQGGKMVVRDLEDPAHVDERRRAVGMKQTLAEYLATMADFPCPN